MNRTDLARAILKASYLTGTFKLRSGQISNEYFDKYLFESNPNILSAIARHLSEVISADTDILAGLEMGGIPVATAISLITGIPVVFARKEAKAYGTCKLAEGININNKKVCIIEDVVTTGGQVIESAKELRERGAIINNVLCVIERDTKGKQNLKEKGLKLISLFTMDDLKSV